MAGFLLYMYMHRILVVHSIRGSYFPGLTQNVCTHLYKWAQAHNGRLEREDWTPTSWRTTLASTEHI